MAEMTPTPVTRMLWSPISRPLAEEPRPCDLSTAAVLVLGEASSHRAAVAAAIHARGARVQLAYPGAGPSSERDAWLVEGRVPTAIVDLTMPPSYGLLDRTTWRLPLLRTMAALRACYADWAAELATDRIFYLAVTYLGGGMGYDPDDSVAQPLGGLWAGLAKTLHRELPNCNARIVDIDPEDQAQLPAMVADELGRRGSVEVGYLRGKRVTLRGRAAAVGPPQGTLWTGGRVVVSGGGRGIGYRLACLLADKREMRVVVTGRGPLADAEPWARTTPEELAEHDEQLWKQRHSGRSVVDVRAEIKRTHELWELASNLHTAREQGLDIEYQQCDVTKRGRVRALLSELDDVRGVVHNAGVDSPSRLSQKTDDQVLRTVSTKLDGFANLFSTALELELDLDFFCTVGSLTGRLGGMVGQFDYAAANDALARLGMWAQRQARFPVVTLAWPTWNRVGLIANFTASLRYMSALDVDEGLALWDAELCAGTSGEVTFVGALGRALDPGQAIGYEFPPDLPDHQATARRLFHLGSVSRYEPGRLLVAEVVFDPAESPPVGDLLVNGQPAVPPSVLIENAAAAADWVISPDRPQLVLSRIEDLVIRPALLVCDRVDVDGAPVGNQHGGVTFTRELYATSAGDQLWVSATFCPADAQGTPAVGLRMLFESAERSEEAEPANAAGRSEGAALEPVYLHRQPVSGEAQPVSLRWRGRVLPVLPASGEDGEYGVEASDQDRWVVPVPPSSPVPVAALENVLRLAISALPRNEHDLLSVDRIDLTGALPRNYLVRPTPAGWIVLAADSEDRVLATTPINSRLPAVPESTSRKRPS